MTDIDLDYLPHLDHNTDYRIGVVGAGFIVRECHLIAYQKAGFNVVAIASHTPAHAQKLAAQFDIPKVYDTYEELCADSEIEIVDIAFPPEHQLDVVRAAAANEKHILAQKPLAWTYEDAVQIVETAERAGVKLGVNQNMRYDQAVRSVKTLLNHGLLGEVIVATIELRVLDIPQTYSRGYRCQWMNEDIHHMDCFRYWFGEPTRIVVSQTRYPDQVFVGESISLAILEYEGNLRCALWSDTFSWTDDDKYNRFRIEGPDGIARGTVGWMYHPEGAPSTLDFTFRDRPGVWHRPRWSERWFPDAFVGTMAQLMRAIDEDTEPEISGRDNLNSIALALAGYRSVDEGRWVSPAEILDSYTDLPL
ncbi:MAG: Gfo/Idh/MocA family oxidoreductase [Candidatus Bipolaricaulia bacterium]